MNWSVCRERWGRKPSACADRSAWRRRSLPPTNTKPAASTSFFTVSGSILCRVAVSSGPGARFGGVVQNQIDAARLQGIEYRLVEYRHIDAREIMQVVIILRRPDQIDGLRRLQG